MNPFDNEESARLQHMARIVMRQRITVFGSNHSHGEHVEVSPMEHQWGEDQNGARDE